MVAIHVEPADADTVTLRVSDTGIGMSPEEIPVALAPFGQVDSRLARRHAREPGSACRLTKVLIELRCGEVNSLARQRPGQGNGWWLGHIAADARDARDGDRRAARQRRRQSPPNQAAPPMARRRIWSRFRVACRRVRAGNGASGRVPIPDRRPLVSVDPADRRPVCRRRDLQQLSAFAPSRRPLFWRKQPDDGL